MNSTLLKYTISILLAFSITPNLNSQTSQYNSGNDLYGEAEKYLINYINDTSFNTLAGYTKKDSIFIENISINRKTKIIHISFDKGFSYAPIRENILQNITKGFTERLNPSLKKYEVRFYSDGHQIENLIPNIYQSHKKNIDKDRTYGKINRKNAPLVENISKPTIQKSNLYKLNFAIWPSHGYYYDNNLHRWEWQRARLFNTVEDLYPLTFTYNYLVPMLENAGANVFMPREREWQIHEVIVDNDSSNYASLFVTNNEAEIISTGFALSDSNITIENSFKLGTALEFKSNKKESLTIDYIPNIPETDYYPVYISYAKTPNNITDAYYRVYHAGGITNFLVNQQIGAGTWIYLGKFKFNKGINPTIGKVVLSNKSNSNNKTVTADAVRFGSGMGNIERNGLLSERPRYQEAARYYLQYAGFPDSLIWHLREKEDDELDNDYRDDIRSRGEWVNYLKNTEYGLGIPIDLTFAFHTDAGIYGNDSVVGTLAIYNSTKNGSKFPDGLSKMASRDMTDIIQTQIVNDIRIKYDSTWTRRAMWNRGYSEAYRANTPTMLLELLSHQNFTDTRFGNEPVFQFDVCRAIYKGMVKFLSSLYNLSYVIQPLPITHFQTEITDSGEFRLKWDAQIDPLEKTAIPDSYIIYTKFNEGGFDNGRLVETNEYSISNPMPDVIYSFKITAVNKGGESFPSEELSICKNSNSKKTILIINAFDRLGGTAWFNDTRFAGYLDRIDQGVPYMYDLHKVGHQFDYDKNSLWMDDDSPGWGASSAEFEDKIIPGNTFNFSYIHGKSIKNAGYSFASVSDETVENGSINLKNYSLIDFLAGEEKTSFMPKNDSIKHYQIYTDSMLNYLGKYLESGGNLFLSGAHIATDIHMNAQDSIASNLLKYKWRTSNACSNGKFYFTDSTLENRKRHMQFNALYNKHIYTVEAPDALEPTDPLSKTWMRYSQNNMSAGISYNGNYKSIILGFPFETIINEQDRNELMKIILEYLEEDKNNN